MRLNLKWPWYQIQNLIPQHVGDEFLNLDHAWNDLDSGARLWTNIGISGFTKGSVIFIGSGSLLSQNNAKFFWDNTNNRLGVGNSSPQTFIHISDPSSPNLLTLEISSGGANIGRIQFRDAGAAFAYFGYNNTTPIGFGNSGMTWYDGSATEIMRLATAGRLMIQTNQGTSTLSVNGSTENIVVTKTGNYTLTATDHIVLVDSTAAVRTMTLPTAVGITGRRYTIKDWKGQSATNNITIATTSSQTIDGVTTKVMSTNYQSTTVISDGANWSII